MKTKPKVRLNLEFSPELYRRMLTVQRRIDAASVTEVIRRSVWLFDRLSAEIQKRSPNSPESNEALAVSWKELI